MGNKVMSKPKINENDMISVLPIEIIDYILSYLSYFEIYMMRSVSISMYNLIPHIIKELHCYNKIQFNQLSNLCDWISKADDENNNTRLKTLTINSSSISKIPLSLFKISSTIIELNLNDCSQLGLNDSLSGSTNDLNSLIKGCPNLIILDLKNIRIDESTIDILSEMDSLMELGLGRSNVSNYVILRKFKHSRASIWGYNCTMFRTHVHEMFINYPSNNFNVGITSELLDYLNNNSINACAGSSKWSYLLLAVSLINSIELIELLLSNRFINTKHCLSNGENALHISCWKNNVSIVKILLNYGFDINSRKNDGSTPLYIACQEGNYDVVILLLGFKADTTINRYDGDTIIMAATRNKRHDIVSLLLSIS